MIVEVKIKETEWDGPTEQLWIDGKHFLTVGSLCECPEDAIIGRALIPCTTIAELMEMAHRKGNEEFVLKITKL